MIDLAKLDNVVVFLGVIGMVLLFSEPNNVRPAAAAGFIGILCGLVILRIWGTP